jgi:hypothetical protein
VIATNQYAEETEHATVSSVGVKAYIDGIVTGKETRKPRNV